MYHIMTGLSLSLAQFCHYCKSPPVKADVKKSALPNKFTVSQKQSQRKKENLKLFWNAAATGIFIPKG